MNVNALNQTDFNILNNNEKNNGKEVSISFDDQMRQMNHTAFQTDDLLNQFWNMTDKMPKDNQISLTASVMASKVFGKGVNDETKSFLKNVSNRFSPEEIGALKDEIKNHPMIRNKSDQDINSFINEFESFINSQQKGQMNDLQKQQAAPQLKTPEELFFQTAFLKNSGAKSAAAA
ncbi:MAG: hypothetical protein ACQETH_03630 [Candidatus Rifleibacteriota bacterium]